MPVSRPQKVLRHLILNPGVEFTYRKLINATFGAAVDEMKDGSLRAAIYDILSYLEKEGLVKCGITVGQGMRGMRANLRTYSFVATVAKDKVDEESELLYRRYSKIRREARRARRSGRTRRAVTEAPGKPAALPAGMSRRALAAPCEAGGQQAGMSREADPALFLEKNLVPAIEGLTRAMNDFCHILAALPWFMKGEK